MQHNLLRPTSDTKHDKVLFVELFFDLVFVFAIMQVSHFFMNHFTLWGLMQTIFIALSVWWIWIYTTWAANWLNPQKTGIQLMLFALMLAGLLLSVAIPHAFGSHALIFALCYVFIQVGRSLFMCWVLCQHDQRNYRNFIRITTWLATSALFWLLGGLCHADTRYALWTVALAIEYIGPAMGFWLPHMGRSTTRDWQISGAHMAERCSLLMMIALGESLLVTGATFTKIPWDTLNMLSFITAFTSTVAMWWVYFHIGAECATKRISASDDPARIARMGYTYLHILMIIGIILVAVSDKLILIHPMQHTSPLAAFAILGGPAIFLVGNLLFKRVVFGVYANSRLTGLALLATIFPFYTDIPALLLALFATGVLITVGVLEAISLKQHQQTASV